MRVFKRVAAVFFFVACLISVLVIITEPDSASGQIAPAVITFLVGALFWRSSNKTPKPREAKAPYAPELSGMLHVEGLPLAEKTNCHLAIVNDQLVISGGGTELTVNLSQIGAAEVKTDVEIAHYVTSSAVKGIAGGLIFGPLGLVIGSRAKSKEKRTATPYLIINYTSSDNVLSAMMFDASLNSFGLNKFLLKLRPMISNNPKRIVQL